MDDGHKIINFSIATLGDVSLVRNYFQEAEARGVYIVGSAGNTANAGSWNYSPDVTDIPGMFVVSSTRPYPDVTFDRGDYTLSVHNGVSFGHQVDFLGTGFRVAVTSNPDTDNHTGFYTINWGTSQAAPSVAGVIGSVLSVNSCLEAHDVEKLLKATACSDISGYSANQHGAGVVDQAAAVTRAREVYQLMARHLGLEMLAIDLQCF